MVLFDTHKIRITTRNKQLYHYFGSMYVRYFNFDIHLNMHVGV